MKTYGTPMCLVFSPERWRQAVERHEVPSSWSGNPPTSVPRDVLLAHFVACVNGLPAFVRPGLGPDAPVVWKPLAEFLREVEA